MSNFRIIDMHVHPFISDEENGGKRWFTPNLDLSTFQKELQQCNISCVAGSVLDMSGSSSFEDIELINQHMLEVKCRLGDFYIPGMQIHPSFPAQSCQMMEEYYHQHKIRMVGELCPYLTGYQHYYGEAQMEMWQLVSDLKMLVNLHPSDDDDLSALAENFPNMKIVIAHPGVNKKLFCDRIEQMKRYPNLYLDISGAGFTRHGLLEYGIKELGISRFLFGSDYPINSPNLCIYYILQSSFSNSEKQALFADNFMQLLEC